MTWVKFPVKTSVVTNLMKRTREFGNPPGRLKKVSVVILVVTRKNRILGPEKFQLITMVYVSGQFIINPYPNLRPFWGGFPY